ncbi:MAG TPA: hypothetical protein VFA85_03685 [Terriglobales bacterium]|nr:hypothetical protein [Terriglobales bacterium]
MQSSPDEFEKYLKQFRPIAAKDLAIQPAAQSKPRFHFWWAWAFSGATLLIAVAVLLKFEGRPAIDPAITEVPNSSALTVRRANAELSTGYSPKQALDRLAFPLKPQLPEGQQSALNVLGQEKTKL